MYKNRPKPRLRPKDEWRVPRGTTIAAVSTGIMTAVLLIGSVIAVWLLFGRDISKFYDSVFIIPEAQTRASGHILGKYGFDADIVSSDIPDDADMIFMLSDKSDFVYVSMEFEGKKFTAAVNYKDKEAPVCDTYQTEEIEAAVSAVIDDCEPWKVRLEVSQQKNEKAPTGRELFYNVYFTGSNWQELHDERPLDIYVRYFSIEPVRKHFDPLAALYARFRIEFYDEDENVAETFDIE